MKPFILILLSLNSIYFYAQTKNVDLIEWKGVKKMNVKFMNSFIETKVGEPIDSLKINRDIAALTRLNGISNVTFEVSNQELVNKVTFKLIENWSILPNLSLWTTDEATAAFNVGAYEYNFLGRNATIGGFYQYNGVSSVGINFSAPFLFTSNFGIETNFQKLASIEPIFISKTPARYEYTNTGVEILGVYRINYKNSVKLGVNFFKEKYQYLSGTTAPGVPQFLEVDKTLFKSNYIYNNLKYEFYLINGLKSTLFAQYVTSSKDFQDNFMIAWNDLSYFKRIGKTGNWASRLRLGLSSNGESPFAPFALDNNLNIRGIGNIIDRGTGTIVLNTEYRTTLFEKKWFVLQGNAFIDGGSWRKPGGDFSDFINADIFKIHPGIGLRFIHKTIFNATFRIDYGFGITKNASNGIVFGVGQYF